MDKFILIPAFNPGNALIKLVDDIQKQTDIPILIVDDGCNPEIKISDENITIIRNKSNCGKGIALQNGFKWVDMNGFKFSITIDADCSGLVIFGLINISLIFANRDLDLKQIKVIGYDMDYTLIHYHVHKWEERAYHYTLNYLMSL